MGSAAFLFICIFFVLILIPTVGVGYLGFKLISKLGRFPSKTPAIQLSIMIKLAVIEVVSLTLILVMFKILVSE